jgi:hypothetical protein
LEHGACKGRGGAMGFNMLASIER